MTPTITSAVRSRRIWYPALSDYSLCCPARQSVLCTLCGNWTKLRNLIQEPQSAITVLVWPAKSSWPMSKIAANDSTVRAVKIPGPMLDQPVYRCGCWPVQNAYIAASVAGSPVMPQHCGLTRVQASRPATRKYRLQLSFQGTQNSSRTSV